MAKRKENQDELCARDWLLRQGYRDIRRPSSDPPDFVVDGVCAVEVTRLNQRIVIGNDGQSVGEEEVRIPLRRCIEKVVKQLGVPGNERHSWEISCEYDFAEPLPNSKTVARQISKALAPLTEPYNEAVISDIHSRHFNYDKHAGEISYLEIPHLCLDCGICLDLVEVSDKPAKFIVKDPSDGMGIRLSTELESSIKNRVLDKTITIRKQSKVGEYSSWWLVLVDHVCHLPITILSEHELSFITDLRFDFWSRVVIISSLNPDWQYELHSR